MRSGATNRLVESALLAGLSAVLILLAFYVPVIGMPLSFVSPLPIALVVLRHGGRWGGLASIVSAGLLAPLAGWVTALGLWAVYGSIGLAFGLCVRRRYKYAKVLLVTTGAVAVGILAELGASFLISGFTPLDLLDQIAAMLKTAVELNAGLAEGNPMLQQLLVQVSDRNAMLRLIPGSMVLAAFLLSYINVEVLRRFLPRLGYDLDPLPPYRSWSFPEGFAWAGLLSFVGLTYLGARMPDSPLFIVAENVYSISAIVATVQVFSIVIFFSFRAGLPKIVVGLIIVFLIGSTAGNPALSILVPIFGMMDMLMDFRRLRREATE